MVATRNIPALDLIIRDRPCVVAPPAVTPPVCLECLTPLARVTHVSPCPRCSAPLCDTCHGGKYHVAECEIFVSTGVTLDITDYSVNNIFYACILPLRMWRTKTADPVQWEKINFLQEESSDTFHKMGIWQEVSHYIHQKLNVTDISTEEVIKLSGIKVKNKNKLRLKHYKI